MAGVSQRGTTTGINSGGSVPPSTDMGRGASNADMTANGGTGAQDRNGKAISWSQYYAMGNAIPPEVMSQLVAQGIVSPADAKDNATRIGAQQNGTSTTGAGNTSPSNATATGGTYPQGGVDIKSLESDLTGAQRNAFEAMYAVFNGYDLGTLAPQIKTMLVNGYDADTISLLLQQTPEWQQRFAGNEIRKKNGLAVLSPAEYLANEASYRQVLVAHGAPQGFYDQHSDFANWIGNDVSPTEVDSRAKVVSDHLDNADQNWMIAAKQFYNIDKPTAWAYFLDPSKGADLIAKQSAALSVGAAAMDQGLSTSIDRATAISQTGVTAQQAQQGYGQIGSMLPTLTGLGQIDGDPYSQTDAENEVFNGLASAQRKRQSLVQNETGRFSGSSGAGAQTFGKQSPGYGDY